MLHHGTLKPFASTERDGQEEHRSGDQSSPPHLLINCKHAILQSQEHMPVSG